MDRLSANSIHAPSWIIMRRAYLPYSVAFNSLLSGKLVKYGVEDGLYGSSLSCYIVWDDVEYMREYDESSNTMELNFMCSKHNTDSLFELEVYIFGSEQEKLIGLLKLMEIYGT